ncbi:septum formation protein [Pedobacter suwonensis]|uniref:dTTP/UTP pyrophosphatase n=1 Tax=Pedobacter suwonensis TaxID=332999 RepID=A0A1I0T0M7_9SPHI|nr:Maf family protein [Pedobacter suwonensis]SFA45301.1 septum formation protein [Pedobacter suwonensis]
MPVQFPPIILASKSPRRQELLTLMGLNFKVELKDVDESYPGDLSPAEIAVYIAEKKAKAFTADGEIVITADTIVALNGEILGKPADRKHAQEMLTKLSGSKHEVFTGVTLAREGQIHSFYDRTIVYCRAVTAAEIDFYIDHYKPFDKAGSYGVQDWWGIVVVERIEGSYTNVMGLPTEKLYNELLKFI